MPRTGAPEQFIRLTRHVSIVFQRTLRIPDDGTVYPLPPGLGAFPIRRVRDFAKAWVHIADSEMYQRITGDAPPPSPVSARTYTEWGLPWFELYDEHKRDVAAPAGAGGCQVGHPARAGEGDWRRGGRGAGSRGAVAGGDGGRVMRA